MSGILHNYRVFRSFFADTYSSHSLSKPRIIQTYALYHTITLNKTRRKYTNLQLTLKQIPAFAVDGDNQR